MEEVDEVSSFEKKCAEWDVRYDRFKKEFDGLSVHAFNRFYQHREVVGNYSYYSDNEYKESDEYDTVDKVKAAIVSGKLHPERKPRPHNYGWRTHIEVCAFVGLLNPVKEKKRKRLKALEKEVRELKREMIETVREEEFQNHFTGKLLTYATQQLIIDSFKEPSALPTKKLSDCGKNLNEQ